MFLGEAICSVYIQPEGSGPPPPQQLGGFRKEYTQSYQSNEQRNGIQSFQRTYEQTIDKRTVTNGVTSTIENQQVHRQTSLGDSGQQQYRQYELPQQQQQTRSVTSTSYSTQEASDQVDQAIHDLKNLRSESEITEGKALPPTFVRTCTDREVTEGKMTRYDLQYLINC